MLVIVNGGGLVMYSIHKAEAAKSSEIVYMHPNQVTSSTEISQENVRLQKISEAMNDGVAIFELLFDKYGEVTDARVLEISPACERHIGLKREQILGKSILRVNLGIIEKLALGFKSAHSFEFEEYVSGIEKLFHIHAYAVGLNKAILIFTDITKRGGKGNTLPESEEKYRTLFETMGEPFAVHEVIFDDSGRSVDGVVLDVNSAYEKMTGLSKEFVVGKKCSRLYPCVNSAINEMYGEVVRSGQSAHFEYYSVRSDRWFEVYAYSLYKENQLALIFMDISKRKRTEQISHLADEWFQKVFQSSIAFLAVIRMRDYRYIEVNQRFLDIVGYEYAEVVGNTPQNLNLWAEDTQKIDAFQQELITKGTLQNFEFCIRTKGGELVNTLKSASLINLHGELCVLSMGQDISKEKKLEGEMQRLDRLNIVGEMAAGIGHEVRNPMTTVRGYLQVFQKKEEFDKYKKQITTMIEELDLANNIISEFLSLARNKVIILQQGNLNAVVNSLFPLIQADAFRMGHSAVLEIGDIPDSNFDPQEMRQLILNLTRNALEAMQCSGILTIRTYRRNEVIVLEVQDTGSGIPDHVLAELGKPFVTTKENGTGLGLPICYRIAGHHNAKLQINSSPQGTSICVNFPLGG